MAEVPESVGALSGLQTFYCTQSSSLKTAPDALGALSDLQVLSFESCPSLHALPMSVEQLTGLQHLDIRNCYALFEHEGTIKLLEQLLQDCPSLRLRDELRREKCSFIPHLNELADYGQSRRTCVKSSIGQATGQKYADMLTPYVHPIEPCLWADLNVLRDTAYLQLYHGIAIMLSKLVERGKLL